MDYSSLYRNLPANLLTFHIWGVPFTETDLLAVRTRLWGKASEGSLQYLGLELVSFNFEESDEAQ